MKPRTKQQRLVYSLSCKLLRLENELKPWAFETCITHLAYRTKKLTSCLSCGHIWSSDLKVKKSCNCPDCGRKLLIEDTRKKKEYQRRYFSVIDVNNDFQLNRFFEIKCYHYSGYKPTVYVREIVQQWMLPDGRFEVVALNRTRTWYIDSFNGDLEIRDRNSLKSKYNIWPNQVYPKINCLPIYKRNGFKGKFGDVTPFDMFSNILTDTKAETLLKAGQFGLLASRMDYDGERAIDRYWNSIKICIRNRYIVKDTITWFDYLNLLRYFNRDLNSPVYVCPKDLKKAHDKLVIKKNEREKRLKLEQQRKKIEADQKQYIKDKGIFFGIAFTKGSLTIKVLEHVREFLLEGEIHKHCVYSNSYYKKDNSLILSAQVDGISVETIEVSLAEMKVIQSRGLRNESSKYNKQILALMEKNMQIIRDRYSSLKSVAA